MDVNYTNDAWYSLMALVSFIKEKNTGGAGIRWFKRYEQFLEKALADTEKIRVCNNVTFKELDLRCVYFNDWVIAFSIRDDFILIEAVLHKSRIMD
jgi:hypothetical protein